MLNQVIVVGRLTNNPEIRLMADGKTQTTVELSIQRKYKDPETGEYKFDRIPVILWNGIAESAVEHCKQGSVVGIKARLKTSELGTVKVIGEKITFINTTKDD